jgi:hypothetical protein
MGRARWNWALWRRNVQLLSQIMFDDPDVAGGGAWLVCPALEFLSLAASRLIAIIL